MARYDEDDSMSKMNYSSMESSSESKLRSGANSRESYSEQKLRKNAKPKAKAKPVVGRQGASSPAARAKRAPAKSPDQARARNEAGLVKRAPAKSPDQARARNEAGLVKRANTGTPLRSTKPVGDRGMDARLAAKKSAAAPASKNPYGGFSMLARGLSGSGKTNTQTAAFKADQAKLKKAYDIAKAKKGK